MNTSVFRYTLHSRKHSYPSVVIRNGKHFHLFIDFLYIKLFWFRDKASQALVEATRKKKRTKRRNMNRQFPLALARRSDAPRGPILPLNCRRLHLILGADWNFWSWSVSRIICWWRRNLSGTRSVWSPKRRKMRRKDPKLMILEVNEKKKPTNVLYEYFGK